MSKIVYLYVKSLFLYYSFMNCSSDQCCVCWLSISLLPILIMCEVITPHVISIWNIYKFWFYNIQFIQPLLQKKTHPWHFGPNEFFFCHTYDTSMMIIVTKLGIMIDVVGSYFYDKKSWQKMGFSSWAGLRHSCMTFFGPSMTEKTVVEARGRKENFRELPVTVGGRGPRYYRSHRAVLPQGPAVLPLRGAVLPHAPDKQH